MEGNDGRDMVGRVEMKYIQSGIVFVEKLHSQSFHKPQLHKPQLQQD